MEQEMREGVGGSDYRVREERREGGRGKSWQRERERREWGRECDGERQRGGEEVGRNFKDAKLWDVSVSLHLHPTNYLWSALFSHCPSVSYWTCK